MAINLITLSRLAEELARATVAARLYADIDAAADRAERALKNARTVYTQIGELLGSPEASVRKGGAGAVELIGVREQC